MKISSRLIAIGLTMTAAVTSAAAPAGSVPDGSHRAADRGAEVAPITTLDARDATAPPRFEVKAPQGAPNVVIVLIDDIGFGASSAFGGPIRMPTLDRLAESGLKYNRFHTTALCSPTRTALLTGHNHHANNAGRDHGAGDGLSRQHRRPPAEHHDAGRDPAPERLQHGGLRQVSRDSAVGGLRLRPLRSLADRFGLRQVLRLHRRRDQPVGAGDLRRRHPRRAQADAGLSLHRRHDRPGDQLGERPAGADARQAVLHVLRHRRDARAAPRAEGVDREVQGRVQRRLGQAARGDLRAPEEAGRRSRPTPSSPPGRRRFRPGTT